VAPVAAAHRQKPIVELVDTNPVSLLTLWKMKISPLIARLLDEMEGSAHDVSASRTVPPECYTSEEYFAFEKESLFQREWLFVGHQNQIPNPGDYFSVTIAGEPLLATRSADGQVNVLSAVCRHRGYPIGYGPIHSGGNCDALVCPYHKWSYDLKGNLLGAPQMRRTVNLDTLRAETHLPSFKVEIVQGLIFANFDPDAPPLKPTLAKFEKHAENYAVADMVPTPTIIADDLPFNWKVMHENALEPYHTMFIHAGFHEMAPSRLATFMDYETGDGQIMHPTGFVNPDGGFNPAARAAFPIIETLSAEQRGRILFGSIPPTLFFAFLPDQVFLFMIVPKSANSMTLAITWLFPKTTLAWKSFKWAFEVQAAANDVLNVQDQKANIELQIGLRSKFAARGRYCHLETTLPQFNRWLLERMRKNVDHSSSGEQHAHG
jgi:phenylpropionate dioxygenase-like ring-hydroxylating dioxygenase large terminal subunit